MQIDRLFQLVYLLLQRGQVTAAELCERFEVSQRTIYRDVEALCQAGIPLYTTRGRGGGIGLMEGFVLDRSALTEAEKRELLSALQGLSAARSPGSTKLLQKLGAALDSPVTDWVAVDFSDWSGTQEALFLCIKQAILSRQLLRITYASSYGQTTDRDVEPIQLWFKDHAWYLRAYCRVRQAFRLFRLSRIRCATPCAQHFEPREEYSSGEHASTLDGSGYQSFVLLRLHIDAALAYRIYDEFPLAGVERQPDGSFLVNVSFPAGEWVFGFLLSFGPLLEVLEPPEVRRELRTRLQQALSLYERGSHPAEVN